MNPTRTNFRSRLKNDGRHAWRSALVVAVISLLLWAARIPGMWLEQQSFDLPFFLRGSTTVEEALVITMDEASYTQLGQDPVKRWDRALHVDLLTRLKEDGARAVVFDVVFTGAWPDPNVDDDLVNAMKAFGPVVVGGMLEPGGAAQPVNWVEPVMPLDLMATNVAWGLVSMMPDSDEVIRRHYISPDHTNLSWMAASVIGEAPEDPTKPRWLNYYGADGGIPEVSYYQALDTALLPPGYFRDKVVFVGAGQLLSPSGSSMDTFRTPYSSFNGRRLTGVFIQATAFLNLVRGDWLERLPWVAEAWLVFLGGGLMGFLALVLRPMSVFYIGLVLSLAVALLSGMLMIVAGFWVSWLAFVLVSVPIGLGWSVMWYGAQRRRDRQKVPDHSLLHFIAKGSYGEVWLARNAIGAYHAAKIVYRNRFENDSPFEREFRGVKQFMPISRLDDGWVPILHVGRNDEAGYFYYVMELADDEATGRDIVPESYSPHTLASELQRRDCFPLMECIRLGVQLTGAMDFLHKQGLVHRDIKPSNIVYVHGKPRFADIGLITEIRASGDVTYIGTKGFMAPEGPGAPSADIYSLGKLLYQAATGMDPGQFPELPDDMAEAAEESGFLGLYEIIGKACESHSLHRYQGAAEMHEALKSLAERHESTPNG